VAAALALATVGAGLPAASAPADASSPVSILGPTRMSAEGLVASYLAVGHEPRLTVTLPELAQLYVEEGERYGVRADIAWAQALVETGWFRYPDHGQVRYTDNNFAGIGAYDGGARGFGYPDARAGVRAQMQLLRQYADAGAIDELPDPPLVRAPASKQGAVTTWLEMGNGNWATSTRYAETVLRVYFQLVQIAGVAPGGVFDAPAPVARPGDGLWLAGVDGHVYDVGDARFWGSAGGRVQDTAVVGIGLSRTAQGYWLVTADGHVGAYGDAVRWGDAVGRSLAPVVDVAGDPSGSGYWVLTSAGQVYAFGSADRMEPAPGLLPSGTRFAAIAATIDGGGYWIADDAGHVVAVGTAVHHGDTGGLVDPADPVVAFAARPLGDGYWMLTRSGDVLAFGAAEDFGSLRDDEGDEAPVRTAVGLASSVTGAGYWIVAADGHVAGLGDAVDFPYLVRHGGPIFAAAGRMEVATARIT
jgi:hypothetical protein